MPFLDLRFLTPEPSRCTAENVKSSSLPPGKAGGFPSYANVRVKGCWTYLRWAVDSRGQTIDFLFSAKRDAEAAKRYFRRALGQPHTVNADFGEPTHCRRGQEPAYPKAVVELKEGDELWR